jgi:type II secretory pathway predicted ATPase ExeA
MKSKQLATYGLKFNPFSTDIPLEGLYVPPSLEHFRMRLEHLARDGGFALLSGDLGVGKSSALRLCARHLGESADVKVGVLTRAHSRAPDFYREMGDLFGVQLSPHNRWAGSKVLRERWKEHIANVLYRPVLIVDEAQEMPAAVMGELRFLMSSELDSRLLLTVVLAGDTRLLEKLRTADLAPIQSRVRVRLTLDALSPAELQEGLRYLLDSAGNPSLLSKDVQVSLCEQAAGNWRALTIMAAELLDAAEARQARTIDEKLFFEVFAQLKGTKGKPPRGGATHAAR